MREFLEKTIENNKKNIEILKVRIEKSNNFKDIEKWFIDLKRIEQSNETISKIICDYIVGV